MENTYYKYCTVPLCTNTTTKTPNKIFIRVPEDKNRRPKWLKACSRNPGDFSERNNAIHVCEDHFNLEEDMENYLRFRLMGGRKKMKPNVVPHIFHCQLETKISFSVSSKAVAGKRTKTKKRIIGDAAASTSTITKSDSSGSNPKRNPVTDMYSATGDTSSDTLQLQRFFSERDVAVQTDPVVVRNKAVQCKLRVGVRISLSPIKLSEQVEITQKQETSFMRNMPENSLSQKSSKDPYSENASDSDYSATSSEVSD